MPEFKASFGPGSKIGQCDVCTRVEPKDHSNKPVKWCSLCQSWICEGCKLKGWTWETVKTLKRRGEAAIKRMTEAA